MEAPELAQQLQHVGQELNEDNFLGSFSTVDEEVNGVKYREEDRVQQHHHLIGMWEELLEEVKHLSKFTHFLRPIPLSTLCQAATTGLVIIINVSQYGADALIFSANGPIEHLSLPQIDIAVLNELSHNILLQ